MQPEFLAAYASGLLSATTSSGLQYVNIALYHSLNKMSCVKKSLKIEAKIGNDMMILGNKLSDNAIDNTINQFFDLEKERLRIHDSKTMWMYARKDTGEIVISTDNWDRFSNAMREDEKDNN